MDERNFDEGMENLAEQFRQSVEDYVRQRLDTEIAIDDIARLASFFASSYEEGYDREALLKKLSVIPSR